MARQKKPRGPKRIPEQIDSIDEMFVTYAAVNQVAEGPAGLLGALLLVFGDRYVEVLISEEGAAILIEQLEAFLDGDSPKPLDE